MAYVHLSPRSPTDPHADSQLRALAAPEQKRFGCIRDGSGKRYLLGPLYLLMGDTEGALKSFAWFAQTFPDDSGEPLHLLCWTLALYRAGEEAEAVVKLRQMMLSNLYLLPRLLGIEQDEIDMWHPSNWTYKAYVEEFPEEVFALWEPAALQRVHTAYHCEPLSQVRTAISPFTIGCKTNLSGRYAASWWMKPFGSPIRDDTHEQQVG